MGLRSVLQTVIFSLSFQIMTDERVKHTLELLRGIKVLKLNAWEDIISRRLLPMRRKEIYQVFWKNVSYAFTGIVNIKILHIHFLDHLHIALGN